MKKETLKLFIPVLTLFHKTLAFPILVQPKKNYCSKLNGKSSHKSAKIPWITVHPNSLKSVKNSHKTLFISFFLSSFPKTQTENPNPKARTTFSLSSSPSSSSSSSPLPQPRLIPSSRPRLHIGIITTTPSCLVEHHRPGKTSPSSSDPTSNLVRPSRSVVDHLIFPSTPWQPSIYVDLLLADNLNSPCWLAYDAPQLPDLIQADLQPSGFEPEWPASDLYPLHLCWTHI